MRNQPTPQQVLLNKYANKPSVIQWIEDRLEKDDRLGINIAMEEGLLLSSLCSQPHINKVIEIGTQYGCSAAWMALALGEQGHIRTFEKDPECIKNSQITFAHDDVKATGCTIELFEGSALENLAGVEVSGPFDLVFIDANKAGYLDYLNWAKKHTKTGGLIVVDNVYLFGTVFLDECPEKTPVKMWKVMKQLIEEQFADDDYATSIIPTKEGLLISTKK